MILRNGLPAPALSLLDDQAVQTSLAEVHAGHPLVIFFFRGAFCGTSCRDLMRYADVHQRVKEAGADMVAISVDPPDTLADLKRRLKLPFRMLSDIDFSVSHSYGIYRSDEVDEGPQPHGEPGVFVLDVDGNLAFSQIQSGPKGHADPGELVLVLLYMAGNGGRYW